MNLRGKIISEVDKESILIWVIEEVIVLHLVQQNQL